MAKAIVSIGYKQYVMNLDEAFVVAQALAEAERYDTKYHSDEKTSTQHIYAQDGKETINIRLISDVAYQVFKLAGEPDKD